MLETSVSVKCHEVEILLGEKAELSLQSAGASSHSCRADGSCGNLEPKAVVCKVDMGNMSPEDRRVGSLMHNWRNAEEIEQVVVRGLTSPRRKFLVFVVPQSDMASPLLSAMSATRNFDVAARFYDAPGQNEAMLNGAEYVITGGLSKFHAASLFLRKFDLVETYEGYLFLDGDLEFDSDQLSQFLSLAHAVGFSLEQPSVTRDSYCYWNMAYHQPGYIFRDTSFVEVMSPYLSRAALSKALPTFKRFSRVFYRPPQKRRQFDKRAHGKALGTLVIAKTGFQSTLHTGAHDVVNEYENCIVRGASDPWRAIW